MTAWDLVYVPVVTLLVGLELYAAFGQHPRWQTITDITQGFVRRKWWRRFILGCLLALAFTHLVIFWP